MERSNSTIDNNSMKYLPENEFSELKSIPLEDLKVLIYTKVNAIKLDPYIQQIIGYLQKYKII
jgi:hypothetical protein